MLLLVLALQVTLAAPQPVAELDTGKLKGDITQLAWSTDGSEFYVQTVDRDRAGVQAGDRSARGNGANDCVADRRRARKGRLGHSNRRDDDGGCRERGEP